MYFFEDKTRHTKDFIDSSSTFLLSESLEKVNSQFFTTTAAGKKPNEE